MQRGLLYIYTIIAYSILYVFTAILVLLSLLLNLIKGKKALHRIICFWAKGTFYILGKLFRIDGKQHINKENRYILMANHSSLFDIMGIMSIYPNVSWFGRAHLLNIPFFGKFLKSINYVPMKTSDLRNTKQMVEMLINKTENQTVAIFPEGTRTLTGDLNKFRRGFLHVLKATELDILPVSLKGFYKFKPKHRFWFDYSAKLSAKVHPPILYKDIKHLEDYEIINLVQTKIASAL